MFSLLCFDGIWFHVIVFIIIHTFIYMQYVCSYTISIHDCITWVACTHTHVTHTICIVGVQLPIFLKQKVDITSSDEVYGLSRGGDEINSCAEIYKKTLEGLVKLASLQTSLKTLGTSMKVCHHSYYVDVSLDESFVYVWYYFVCEGRGAVAPTSLSFPPLPSPVHLHVWVKMTYFVDPVHAHLAHAHASRTKHSYNALVLTHS